MTNPKEQQVRLIIAVVLISITVISYSTAFIIRRSRPEISAPAPSDTANIPKFMAIEGEKWASYSGMRYPYMFSAPVSLPLVKFEGNATDAYAVEWQNIPVHKNILISVIDLPTKTTTAQYVGKPKREMVENWWRLTPELTGVATLSEFTNLMGLVGYRAQYLRIDWTTPFEDVFFEVPDRPDLMIWLTNGYLDPPLFDSIIETVEWKK